MRYTGAGCTLQIGKESTFGTAVAGTHIVDMTSESIACAVEKGDQGSLLASKTPMSRDLLAVTVDGSISMVLRPQLAGLLFALAMGGTDTVTTVGSHKQHSIVLAGPSVDLPSFTAIVDRGAAIKKYKGCTLSKLSVQAPANNYVTASADLMGTQEETGTLASGLGLTIPSYRCTSATFTIGGTSYDISDCTLSIDNALDEGSKTYASGLYRGRPMHGQRGVTLSFNIPYAADVETLKSTYLLTEANASVVLTFASKSADYTCTVKVPNLAITNVSANVSGTGEIGASVEGVALTVGSTEPLTVEVIDDNATAYNS